jgi:putative CocE/NonD family hydrolase
MPRRYSVRFDSKLPIKLRDGTTTYADVFRPSARGRFPALLTRTPYDRTGPFTRAMSLDSVRAAMSGYAVVIQDVRGRYASEGEFQPFFQEINDGYDSVEWTASQPWCDGKVGMFGGSYVGATQWLAAASRPPSLAAIAPGITASDYHEGWTWQGGAFELSFNLGWVLAHFTAANYPHLVKHAGKPKSGLKKLLAEVDRMDEAFRFAPMKEWPALKDGLAPYYYDWLDHPEYDAYWKKVSIEEYHQKINVPALNYGGWYDIFLGGTLRNYMRMSKMGATPAARKGQRLLIGPWVHPGAAPTFVGSPVGSHYFGANSYSGMIDIHGVLLRHFDQHLKGIGDGDEKPVRIFVMGENVWRYEDDWPLSRAKDTKFFLHSGGRANTLEGDGSLSEDSPGAEPPDTFLYNPHNPVPTRGGGLCCFDSFGNQAGVFDQLPIETRPDVLVYSTPELKRDVEVTGPITVKLYAASSARDTDFTAKLVDVAPGDCSAINLTDGIIRARYRKLRSAAQLIEPGKVYEYTIDLWATSNVFKKGHKIRIEISSSNFPRFDRNTNTGNPIGTDGLEAFKTATQTIFHDDKHPSHVVLPIVPR